MTDNSFQWHDVGELIDSQRQKPAAEEIADMERRVADYAANYLQSPGELVWQWNQMLANPYGNALTQSHVQIGKYISARLEGTGMENRDPMCAPTTKSPWWEEAMEMTPDPNKPTPNTAETGGKLLSRRGSCVMLETEGTPMKLLIQDHKDDADIEALKGRITARNPGSYWVDIPGGWELCSDRAQTSWKLPDHKAKSYAIDLRDLLGETPMASAQSS